MTTSQKEEHPSSLKIRRFGPFITQLVERYRDGTERRIGSRDLRRGIERFREERRERKERRRKRASIFLFRHPRVMSRWIGTLFMIGSLLFVAGSVMSLWFSRSFDGVTINLTFFIGSIFFTAAAYGQLLQAINANIANLTGWRSKRLSWRWWARGLRGAGFLSASSQFIGTVLFNFNTFDAFYHFRHPVGEHLFVWVPNMAGSVLFLISSFFAWVEIYHDEHVRRFVSVTWWVVWLNIAGSIFFQLSAIFGYINPFSGSVVAEDLSIAYTLLGAICFFLGAWLSNLELKKGE